MSDREAAIRLWCRLFGHRWNYGYGVGRNRCLRCGKTWGQ